MPNPLTWPVPSNVKLIKPKSRSWRSFVARLNSADQAVLGSAALESADWAREGILAWSTPGKSARDAVPGRRVLDRFAALHDANGEAFKDFAASYGPLYLCRHGRPLGHRFPLPNGTPSWPDPSGLGVGEPAIENEADAFEESSLKAEWDRRLLNLPCAQTEGLPGSPVSESVSDWRRLATEIRHARSIVEHLNSNRPAPTHLWKSFQSSVGEPVQAWLPNPDDRLDGYEEAAWDALAARQRRTLVVNAQRRWIAFFIDEWLRQSLLRPRFYWESRGPRLEPLGPGSLYGAIVLELAHETHDTSRVLCSNCGRQFKASRKPAVGRDPYCDRGECKAARKVAHRLRLTPEGPGAR